MYAGVKIDILYYDNLTYLCIILVRQGQHPNQGWLSIFISITSLGSITSTAIQSPWDEEHELLLLSGITRGDVDVGFRDLRGRGFWKVLSFGLMFLIGLGLLEVGGGEVVGCASCRPPGLLLCGSVLTDRFRREALPLPRLTLISSASA